MIINDNNQPYNEIEKYINKEESLRKKCLLLASTSKERDNIAVYLVFYAKSCYVIVINNHIHYIYSYKELVIMAVDIILDQVTNINFIEDNFKNDILKTEKINVESLKEK